MNGQTVAVGVALAIAYVVASIIYGPWIEQAISDISAWIVGK